MRFSISTSKITPPHLSKVLYRPRLLNLLEKNKDKKLILVLGQAAQGKSTLAASYVTTSKTPCAWMNLDKGDSDPVNLFYLVAYSLQYTLKEIDLYHLLSYPVGTIESRSEIPFFRELAQSIFEQISNPICIIVDGLDQLSADRSAFKFLQALVETSPTNVQFLMLSREIPPLPLEFQNLKMRQEAFILRNEDLAFTQEEIRTFFHEIRKISFNTEQFKKIYLATEGWVGGLILLSESLSRFPETTRERFISEELPDHFKKEVFQYFGKEILSSQPEQVQEFLIKSSIVDFIEPGFMKDLIGIEKAEDILREHVRKNLFVQSFYDEKKGWLFRYHHIFRDFLKAKSKERIGKEESHSLLLKAGILYEQRNELQNAVKYFLEAKDYPRAVPIIEQLGMEYLSKGRRSDLSEWISTLPDEIIQENPWLLLYQSMVQPYSLGIETVGSLEKAYKLFKQREEISGILLSVARLILVSIHTGIQPIPIVDLIMEAEAGLQSSRLEKYPREKALLLYSIGTGYILALGDIRKGVMFCQNASRLFNQIKEISLQVNAQALSALGLVQIGEFSATEETLRSIERSIEKDVHPESKAPQLMVNCLLSIYQGQFIKARDLVEKLQMEIEKYGFVSMVPWTFEISGYLEFYQKKFVEAEEIGNRYLNLAQSIKNPVYKGLALRLLGLISLHRGDFKKAKELTRQVIEVFSKEAPSRYELNRAKMIMGLVGYHLKEYEAAEEELQESLSYFNGISGYYSLAETHFIMAFHKFVKGKRDEAASHLRAGFKIAEEKKYGYFYILSDEYLKKACLLVLELKVREAVNYATYLFSTRFSQSAEVDLRTLSNHPDQIIKEKVWEIRRQIHRSRIPHLSIETLGGFRVIRGDDVIKEDEWDRSQPKQLLKVIVSYAAKGVPKEVLIDQLWPEERPKSAESDFKTTLRRLRKSLEPEIDKDFGSSYIHLQDNVVSIDAGLCQVDVDLFLLLLRNGEEKEKAGDVKEALLIYNDAIEMYKGDFLAEEFYIPWANRKREELKGKYIELLSKAASLHDRQGTVKKAIECYKKAIRADSLLEESYQRLMTLYSSKGMYNEALRTYEACKKVLKEELKSKPDPMTTALYNKILEKIQSS
jgi:LuxR family maltose regulon positive regulatory protein